jgi:hypothetical protein
MALIPSNVGGAISSDYAKADSSSPGPSSIEDRLYQS